ncbi:MAG: hypothetical protein FWG34_15405 [Oscillospiraceae bacterium]|nr:hypothetical protein [Oscillospiraceae bacterium]
MRDKIYLCTTFGMFLIIFFWCPVLFLMEKAGLVAVEDLANYKDPEKAYYFDRIEQTVKTARYGAVPDEFKDSSAAPFVSRLCMDALNGIEEGKAALNAVYTNYLPFYFAVLSFSNNAGRTVQDGFVMMLFDIENKQNNRPAEENSGSPGILETGGAPVLPQFVASKISDAGMFRVYRVRSADDETGFLDISMAMPHDLAYEHMLEEQWHINRISAANKEVNFFVFIATRMQDTAYYNEINPHEPSTKDLFDDFIAGLGDEVAGVSWLDIDTFEKRMERCFKTDHHWNAWGAYQGYAAIIDMINKTAPEIGEPLPLKGMIEFPNVEYRGSGAGRTNTPVYHDTFQVMDVDLPEGHPTERVHSKLEEYLSGKWDIDKLGKNDYTSHYENFYDTPQIITYPKNNTGRRLLILGDSYAYWVTWLIGANFDKTFVHYTLWERDLNYNEFIKDNGITDVLLLQYSARTLSKATSAAKYLEQVITD